MPDLSIIIPVYDAERYIRQCVRSILKQSGCDFEVILVDDGSRDGSSVICDELVATDSRIRVLHLENGGAGKARNAGLEIAGGNHIWFIDADDWIEDDFLSSFNWDNMPDILFFGFTRKSGATKETCRIQDHDEEFHGNLGDVFIRLFESRNQYFGYTWNKIFRRSLIFDKDIRFRENLIIKEDEVFTLEYCKHVASLKISSAVPYNYRILPTSLSHSTTKKRNIYELACFLDSEIKNPLYPDSFRESLKNAVFRYYREAIFENTGNCDIDSRIDSYIEFYLHNKDNLRLSAKIRMFFLVPTNYLKHKFTRFYINMRHLKKYFTLIYQELRCLSFSSILFRMRVANCGRCLTVGKKVSIFNPRFVTVGNDVIINHHVSLFVNPLRESASLIIGNGVQLGKYNDFGCSNRIVIEDFVITAPFVHITDRDHTYDNIDTPIMHQPANSKGPVTICRGCWIGFGVQIMSGVTIGKQSVIAAGSIVTKDIPDYSVAAGNPARVIKRYNLTTNKWEKV